MRVNLRLVSGFICHIHRISQTVKEATSVIEYPFKYALGSLITIHLLRSTFNDKLEAFRKIPP